MYKLIFRDTGIYYLLIPVLFILVYFQVFFSDYAYLDEIHQLWHNNDNSNFVLFHTQGRWLTGLLFEKLFSSISRIEQLKYLRIFSLVGWMVTTFVSAYLFKKWQRFVGYRRELWSLAVLYFVCGISVCVYIGWASCMEVFMAIAFGLLSADILFTGLIKQDKKLNLIAKRTLGSLFFGIVALFIYQPSFGIFLIPFFLYYVVQRKSKPDRVFNVGLIFYFFIYVIYYLLFKYSLNYYQLDASNRTAIQFDLVKKVSFFFSGPFPQGFSINLLFYAGSIFSQAFYILVFVTWLIIIFRRDSPRGVARKLFFAGFILFQLALIYLPSMIAAENFPSYRTLFVFNLGVFLLVAESFFSLARTEGVKKAFLAITIVWVLGTGFYAFNFQYINPLKKEYSVLKNFFHENYNRSITRICFIRADKLLFSSHFHTKVYRDELGAPSTYRDWVPEPIVKQMIFEITHDRNRAEKTEVIQFENILAFNESIKVADAANTLVIDMNSLFSRSK